MIPFHGLLFLQIPYVTGVYQKTLQQKNRQKIKKNQEIKMNFPHQACRVCLERYVAALIPITDKTSTDMSIYEIIQFVCDVPVFSMIFPRNLKITKIFSIPTGPARRPLSTIHLRVLLAINGGGF